MPSAAQRFSKLKISARRTRAGATPAFKPGSDLDEVATALAVFGIGVSQVTSNRVFQDRQQQFQFALDNVISPDQIDVLYRQQEPGIDCFFAGGGAAAAG